MHKILCSLLLLVGCQNSTSSHLTVGTNAEFPPYTFIEKGEIVGFDVDIAKEIGKRMGKEIQFKDMPFDALIPDLIFNKIDFIAAGLTVTEERAKRIAFTKPYLQGEPLVILSLNNITDLKGKKVIVNDGFTADLFLSGQKGIELIRLPTTAEGFLALKSGRADAFVTAQSTIDTFFKTHERSNYYLNPIPNTAENCALAISKSNPQLLADIQIVLDQMEEDGTLNKIKTKWNL